jgi:hypothetical protein
MEATNDDVTKEFFFSGRETGDDMKTAQSEMERKMEREGRCAD